MNDLAEAGHGGLRRWEQFTRFRVAGSITGHHRGPHPPADVLLRLGWAGLLRRLDYSVDILGGGAAVHYPSAYREFGGIMVPTRRRVFVRRADGSPVLDPVSVAIDFTDVTFF